MDYRGIPRSWGKGKLLEEESPAVWKQEMIGCGGLLQELAH
jgi:hypothetical protein